MRSSLVMALLLGLAVLTPASAETEVDPAVIKAAEPLAGVYVFSRLPEDGDSCTIYLEGKPDFATMRAWVAAGCETRIFFMSELMGWMPLNGGAVRLIGAELTPLADFTPGNDGVLTSVIENDGKTYTLKRAPWAE